MTFFSLAAAGGFLAVTKAANPGMNIRPLVMLLCGVALGCFIMTVLSGRKSDERQ